GLEYPDCGIEIGINGHEHAGHALERIHGRDVERVCPIQIGPAEPQAQSGIAADVEKWKMPKPDEREAQQHNDISGRIGQPRDRSSKDWFRRSAGHPGVHNPSALLSRPSRSRQLLSAKSPKRNSSRASTARSNVSSV